MILVSGCQGTAGNATPQASSVDIASISIKYVATSTVFDTKMRQIAGQLSQATTVNELRKAYAAAATAEHELDSALLALPLFPTRLRDDWKRLLMANRRVEDLYTQLSLITTMPEAGGLQPALTAAKAAQSTAESQFRKDLVIPERAST